MRTILIAAGLLATNLFAVAGDNDAPKSAKLIIFRKGCIYGSMAKYKVIEDNQQVTTLKPKAYEVLSLTPGSHTIAPKNPNKGVTINAQDGQTYVVEYKTRFGLFGARPKLKVLSVDEAKNESTFFAEHYNMNGGGMMNSGSSATVNMKQ